jgi:hypothetical protein
LQVKTEVRSISDSLSSMESRLASVETASKRSADGIEILVSLVATSQMFAAGATPETSNRLSRFCELQGPAGYNTGGGPLEIRHNKKMEHGALQMEHGTLPSPPAAPPPPPPGTPRTQPGYLQSIFLQSAGT